MVNIGIILNYDDVFDDEPSDINFYLDQLGRNDLLPIVSLLLNATTSDYFKFSNKEVIEKWFSPENIYISEKLVQLDIKGRKLLNTISSLDLYELVIKMDEASVSVVDQIQLEIILLKIYLLFNSRSIANESKNLKELELLKEKDLDLALIGYVLPVSFIDHDFSNFDRHISFSAQVYKAIEFFRYLESNNLDEHLSVFYEDFGLKTWKEYIIKYFTIALPVLKRKTTGSFFIHNLDPETDTYNSDVRFFDMLTAGPTDDFSKADYIAMRSKPIVKVNENKYQIINEVFLIDFLYKSLIFKFSLDINTRVSKENRITNFRSEFCYNFSENHLLYELMPKIFPKKWRLLSGKKFTQENISGEPDYYARYRNKLFLFESKDIVLTGDQKASRNFKVISDAIEKKLRYEIKVKKNKEKLVKRSIYQLISMIDEVYKGSYDVLDDSINHSAVKIYPIIILHDRQFDSLGVNNLVSKWFDTDLKELLPGLNTENVMKPIIINIDSLIAFQDLLKSRTFTLEKVIAKYIDHVEMRYNKPRNFRESFQRQSDIGISFTDFLNITILKSGKWRMPLFLKEYTTSLF